jgi:hypothetical protein
VDFNDIQKRNFILNNLNILPVNILSIYDEIIDLEWQNDLWIYCYLYINKGIYIHKNILFTNKIINSIDIQKNNFCVDENKNYLNYLIFIKDKNLLYELIINIINNIKLKKDYYIYNKNLIYNLTNKNIFNEFINKNLLKTYNFININSNIYDSKNNKVAINNINFNNSLELWNNKYIFYNKLIYENNDILIYIYCENINFDSIDIKKINNFIIINSNYFLIVKIIKYKQNITENIIYRNINANTSTTINI